jgi:uncharacterized repeat protein (TIGR01451 family)
MLESPFIYECRLQNNQLTSFVMQAPLMIAELYLDSNPLVFFSTHPTYFESLSFSNTQLEMLDLGNVMGIAFMLSINDNPNLTWINLANGNFEGEPGNSLLSISNNPQLQTICVDDLGYIINEGGDLIEVSEYISVTAAVPPGVNVTTYCSFTPPGPFHTVSGVLRYDLNGDGCDESDPVMPFVRIDITGAGGNGAVYTDQNGEYIYYTTGDSVTLHPVMDTNAFTSFSPVSIEFSSETSVIQDFCTVAGSPVADMEIAIAPLIPARPGFEAVYNVTMRNKGNTVISQPLGVNFTFDSTRMQFADASQTPDAQTPGSLSWNYSDFLPYESRSFTLTFDVNSPTGTPPVNNGDILTFAAAITPQVGDLTPDDNQFSLVQTVVGAFDPNNKLCLQGGVAPLSQIGDYLHYVINFENTGTFEAQNVVVKDVIDPTMYDLSTLQILDASHEVAARVINNAVEFIFEGIDLEIGGHGNILLKVKSLGTLTDGDQVENDANIYFDYNHPVLTDPAITLFQLLKIEEVSGVAMTIWPNPSAGIINLKSESAITKMELYDVQGRLLLVKSGNSAEESIDLSSQTNGIYLLRVTTQKGVGNIRLVRG